MPFVPVPNAALVELRFIVDEQHVENTLYFERADAPDADNLLALLNAVEAWWIDNMLPLQPIGVVLHELVATDLSSDSGPQVTVAPVGGDEGSVDSPLEPNNVTLAISFRTGLRGRSFRGRNYVPALWKAAITKNTVGSTIVAAFAAAYTELITDTAVADAGWTWSVVSRFHGVDGDGKPIPRETGIVTPITTVVITDSVVDSQRRRLPGRGS